MTGGGQCSDNLESFSGLFVRVVWSSGWWLQLVTVANLGRASVGEVCLAAGVENLVAELELVLLQAVDVVLQLGQLGVESFLLGSEGDLKVGNMFGGRVVVVGGLAGWPLSSD